MSEYENKRIKALHSYKILDTEVEQCFDDITQIASEICKTPMAIISLVDSDRQWFKSRIGLDVPETPRSLSFCSHAIEGNDLMVVKDASKDPRFLDHPYVVGEGAVRFYAGAPLIDAQGFALGTLCVVDRSVRELTSAQKDCLKALSRQVIFLMESRRRLLENNSLAAARESKLQSQNDLLENALALRAENLDFLFKSLPQIIWTANAQGKIDLCNEKWTALTGMTYRQTMGDGWLTAVHPDDINEALFKWDYCLKTESIYTNEMRFKDSHGEYRWFLVRGVPAKESRDLNTSWFGTCTDIQELKNAQNEKNDLQVKANSAMEASRLKTEFLANMSHEIRTPINGIIGMTNLLADSNLDTEQQGFTNSIISSSKILLTLINDILDITKIEAGKLDFEEMPFDLTALLNQSKTNFENQFKAKGVDFNCHFSVDETVTYIGDASRIQQIINNLLSNANKFTEKGAVIFNVSQVHNGIAPCLQFEIKDTGIGISEDVLPKLFTNFSQADASMSRKFGGSGLGLAISRQLVQRMGGDMCVESQRHHGSVFKFTLGLKTVLKSVFIEPSKQKPVVENKARSKFCVLVAEDNLINQEITIRMLKKAGYRAEVVTNGKEALNAVEQYDYDLILMDCQMPEMDGYEATRVLRQRQFAPPIIALTANAFKEDREKCMDAGMTDFLTKPLYINHLIDVLDRWLAVDLAS